ncbi:MAG TPA: hypothetical protein VHC86_10780 [Opitutaceae bacterium]|nr:hypothetical protein [Opitutaceae bacterium]
MSDPNSQQKRLWQPSPADLAIVAASLARGEGSAESRFDQAYQLLMEAREFLERTPDSTFEQMADEKLATWAERKTFAEIVSRGGWMHKYWKAPQSIDQALRRWRSKDWGKSRDSILRKLDQIAARWKGQGSGAPRDARTVTGSDVAFFKAMLDLEARERKEARAHRAKALRGRASRPAA